MCTEDSCADPQLDKLERNHVSSAVAAAGIKLTWLCKVSWRV